MVFININENSINTKQTSLQKDKFKPKDYVHFKSDYNNKLIKTNNYSSNAWVNGIINAFVNHKGLEIKPDDIFLQILMQFAKHINDCESMYSSILEDKTKNKTKDNANEKTQITIIYAANSWKEVPIDDFINKIITELSKLVSTDSKLFIADFTTTNDVIKTISQSVFASACKNYYRYMLYTMCAITGIELLGTLEDWISMRDKFIGLKSITDQVKDIEYSKWFERIILICDKIIKSYQEPNSQESKLFWNEFIKSSSCVGSGHHYYCADGWLTNLFYKGFIDPNKYEFDNLNLDIKTNELKKHMKFNWNQVNDCLLQLHFKTKHLTNPEQDAYLYSHVIGFSEENNLYKSHYAYWTSESDKYVADLGF